MELNNAIEKSLFDKEVESFIYNPELVINKDTKNIKDKIIELISRSSRVDIAVSYSVWSGLSLIYEDLKKFNKDSRIIVTTEGFVTDLRSLNKLNELDMQIKVYVPNNNSKGFHLKTYMFEDGLNRTLLIGSSNISARAFGLVHEMAVEINAKSNGYIVEEYSNVFDKLWYSNCSKKLNKDVIEEYEKAYKGKKEADKEVANLKLQYNKIQPNYMQEKALVELEECRKTSDRGLVIAATGTGKTYLSAFDVKQSNANKVLFLVHNRLILSSAIDTFKKVFKDKKILELNSSNEDKIFESDFIFTTDKSAYNLLYKKVSEDYFDYIIYDEAHKIGFETKYSELLGYFIPKFTLGITATPERTDNPEYLFETFQYNVPYEIRLLEAMDNELVCPFTYYGLNLENDLLDNNEKFNYNKLSVYIKNIIDDKGYYSEKLRGIVFCSDIEEAINISIELNKIGYVSKVAVSGNKSVSKEEIENYILSLKSDTLGSVELICVVNKFNEGIDIPDINTIIMLRNTTSSIIYLQQLGRGLRRTEDIHKYVTVYDIIGNSKNNYSIAEVLTGNTTVDKRKLYDYANKGFKTVSPFINVDIEEKAMEKIIKSISNNFTVKTRLKNKFKDELYRFKEIPTLKELYSNPNFKELELLQLLFKNFYDPFENYYKDKYNIKKGNKFVSNFFTLISQFVFRAYSNDILIDYVKLLKGEKISNNVLRKILLPKLFKDGINTAIYSNYNKKDYNFSEIFKYQNNLIYLNPIIINKLEKENALQLFKEHIELFDYKSKEKSYKMKIFDLVDKAEFLYNSNSNDCYMNAVGERIDKINKKVYCTIKITKKESFYDNHIVDNDKIVYYTQNSGTKEKAISKIKDLIENKYEFYICAQFSHLGYTSTSFFNLGQVKVNKVSEVKEHKGKYNHEIEFMLERNIPKELLQYK